METSKPVEKTILVMESMCAHPKKIFYLDPLSKECKIPKTTLLRILNTFIQCGYVTKTVDKGYLCNFLFTNELPLDSQHLGRIEEILKGLVEECQQSVEILTVNGKNLQWYEKLEHQNLSVRVMAAVGYKRTLYELDAPARAYLKFIGLDRVAAEFEPSSFYTAATEFKSLTWEEARQVIESSAASGSEHDLAGNRNGVRRFSTVISSSSGDFLYLLCIAEPALWMNNEEEHFRKNILLLQKYKEELMEFRP